MTILGTRPEIIRLSRLMSKLDELQSIDHVLVHTGQNYDYELNQVFFEDLAVRKPDYFLDVDTSSVGHVYGEVLIKSEEVFVTERPDALLILGDTNSAIAAIIAKRLHIPIFHMEAGNRCFDWRVPEETNRHIVDSISDINLVYTEHARRNLMNEGHRADRVYLTGSPMAEILKFYREGINSSTVLEREGLTEGRYFVASLHREDNVDDPAILKRLLAGVEALTDEYELPAVLSLHPRTARRAEEHGIDLAGERMLVRPPFGFLDYIRLQMDARCVISDSGTISEESGILGFPAVTPRRSMERPEALDAGIVVLSGSEQHDLLAAVEFAVGRDMSRIVTPAEYSVVDFSDRVLSVLLSRPLVSG